MKSQGSKTQFPPPTKLDSNSITINHSRSIQTCSIDIMALKSLPSSGGIITIQHNQSHALSYTLCILYGHLKSRFPQTINIMQHLPCTNICHDPVQTEFSTEYPEFPRTQDFLNSILKLKPLIMLLLSIIITNSSKLPNPSTTTDFS